MLPVRIQNRKQKYIIKFSIQKQKKHTQREANACTHTQNIYSNEYGGIAFKIYVSRRTYNQEYHSVGYYLYDIVCNYYSFDFEWFSVLHETFTIPNKVQIS